MILGSRVLSVRTRLRKWPGSTSVRIARTLRPSDPPPGRWPVVLHRQRLQVTAVQLASAGGTTSSARSGEGSAADPRVRPGTAPAGIFGRAHASGSRCRKERRRPGSPLCQGRVPRVHGAVCSSRPRSTWVGADQRTRCASAARSGGQPRGLVPLIGSLFYGVRSRLHA